MLLCCKNVGCSSVSCMHASSPLVLFCFVLLMLLLLLLLLRMGHDVAYYSIKRLYPSCHRSPHPLCFVLALARVVGANAQFLFLSLLYARERNVSTNFFFFLTHHFSIQNGKYLFCFSFCVRGVVFCAPMRMVGFGFYLGKKEKEARLPFATRVLIFLFHPCD